VWHIAGWRWSGITHHCSGRQHDLSLIEIDRSTRQAFTFSVSLQPDILARSVTSLHGFKYDEERSTSARLFGGARPSRQVRKLGIMVAGGECKREERLENDQ